MSSSRAKDPHDYKGIFQLCSRHRECMKVVPSFHNLIDLKLHFYLTALFVLLTFRDLSRTPS